MSNTPNHDNQPF